MRSFKLPVAAVVAAAALSGPAIAGGFAPAVTQPQATVVVEPTAPRSSLGIILPLLLLGGAVAAASGGDGGSANGTRGRGRN
jgi:hypothetical protein